MNHEPSVDQEVRRLREELRTANERNHERNLLLDALAMVWCSGGCGGGVFRWTEATLSLSVLRAAIVNVARMLDWAITAHFRAGSPDQQSMTRLYATNLRRAMSAASETLHDLAHLMTLEPSERSSPAWIDAAMAERLYEAINVLRKPLATPSTAHRAEPRKAAAILADVREIIGARRGEDPAELLHQLLENLTQATKELHAALPEDRRPDGKAYSALGFLGATLDAAIHFVRDPEGFGPGAAQGQADAATVAAHLRDLGFWAHVEDGAVRLKKPAGTSTYPIRGTTAECVRTIVSKERECARRWWHHMGSGR